MLTSSIQSRTIAGSDVPLVFGRGELARLGELAAAHGARHALLVTDPGIVAAGHAARALASLHRASVQTTLFSGIQENPTTAHVNAGLALARQNPLDLIIGLGGGSAMDCAKGINFLYTNGGKMSDYRGVNKADKPMLPLIAVPTTAGTGSEAQSFALITDPVTHEKMACGDVKALPKLAILDPELLATCPLKVAAATGIDAISHALETAACTKRNETSRTLSKDAWKHLNSAFPAVLASETNTRKSPIADMLLGAHLAGAAIQNSMLGAAHACANPLTAAYNITHGLAVGLMLPHVIAFNTQLNNPYSDLDADPAHLLHRIRELLALAQIPTTLKHYNIPQADLPALAQQAALQWTASFNPRPVTPTDLLAIYQQAFS